LLKLFSLPILVGIGFGVVFPYQSMSLIWLSSILLFLLLFLNTLAIEVGQVRLSLSQNWSPSLLALFLIFGLFPLILAAAARLLLKDQDFAFGLVVSALAPCALVNPFFARLRGGDAPLSLVHVILSTLACPFLTLPMLKALGFESVYLDFNYTLLYLASLTILPVGVSLLVARAWPTIQKKMAPALPPLNSLILAMLMFILVGSSLSRVPVRFLSQSDFLVLIAFYLLMDFGFYWGVKYSGRLFFNAATSETLALSVASRNFAVSASLMLFFHPKAALPSAVGLMIHALFFQWLVWRKR